MSHQIDIESNSQSSELPSDDAICRWLTAALDSQARVAAEVSVYIVDEEEGRALNFQYRHKDYATNVLSFAADLPKGVDLPLLGDLVICAPVVAREAREQNKTSEAHWAHMLVHGCLHLLGFDHQEDAQADVMEALETGILLGLEFAPPYAQID